MLVIVVEGGKSGPEILPIKFASPLKNAEAARRYVSSLAMNGNSVALKALTLITKHAMPNKPVARRRKAKA